ncbi:MAG: threonine ammonia-lyase [Deltaproteobacteria bacterium]|nr:threonine ammonia-lyase [Deltaproteobacteria bacterium]
MFSLIKAASRKLKGIIQPTPLIFSSSFSNSFGFEVYLKLENLQKTGSFKARGAYNRLSALTDDEKARGVVTASSGNHAQGVAWASTLLGVRSTIVMPETSPMIKQVATRGYGGDVILYGRSFDESYDHATALSREKGLTFIAPYDDNLVIAGQGTIGLEIMESIPDADTVVVPIGGGGLISGIAVAVKGINKGIKVIGVEADASASCALSLKKGFPAGVEKRPTVADGIAVKRIGALTFPIIQKLVDDAVSVREDTIAAAILKFIERKKLVVEGAGAVTLAAAMEGKLPASAKKAVLVVSGGNIDVTALDRVIRLGLLREGRIMRLTMVLPDVPGSLAGLTAGIASLKANILHILHQREAVDLPVGSAGIEVILEVEGPVHGKNVLKGLRGKGYEV